MATQVTYQTQAVESNNSTFLRNALKGNGTFSLVSGLAFITGATPIAAFLGLTTPTILIVTGILLLAFAVDLFFLATRQQMNPMWVMAVIGADVLWVLGSIALLLTNIVPLTTGGQWAVGIVAGIVAIFAELQFIGLQKMNSNQS